MSRAGKFIPGGAGRKTSSLGVRTGPIRAPDGSAAPGGGKPEPGKKENRLFTKGGLTRAVPKDRRMPIMIMSGITCFLLVSVAWWFMGVLPAKRAYQAEVEKEAAVQKQLADEKAAEQAKAVADAKARAAALATVIVNSVPSGSVTIGNAHLPTPATFTDVTPGKINVLIQAPGYEDYQQDLTAASDKPTDLGTIQLVPLAGNLSLTTAEKDITYTLTGPNGYSHDGQVPDRLTGLPAGDYQFTVRQRDWQLAPATLTIHDRDDLRREVKLPYGSASIQSVPPGATVRNGNTILGPTPLTLSQLRPGKMNISVDLPPYTIQRFTLTIPESSNVVRQIVLQQDRDFIAACGMPMVWIPDAGYWVGKYDVTQKVFEAVTNSNPSTFRRPNRPVETVSWETAMAFCERLNQTEAKAGKLPHGYHYSLPTESQWDAFSADANMDTAVMSRSTTLAATEDVGSSEPNKYGLYDTLGNVWEWCLDNYDDHGDHSLRGGSWLSSSDNFPSPETRSAGGEKYADRFTGFRVVLVPTQ
jgi:hypothetical protein